MVNDLTLILLTWRKWWANNASKEQMGFNSGFKGLNKRNLRVNVVHSVDLLDIGWSVVQTLGRFSVYSLGHIEEALRVFQLPLLSLPIVYKEERDWRFNGLKPMFRSPYSHAIYQWKCAVCPKRICMLLMNCGFESQRGHEGLSVVSVVCCQVEFSATSWSLVQRSPTDCAASLCVI